MARPSDGSLPSDYDSQSQFNVEIAMTGVDVLVEDAESGSDEAAEFLRDLAADISAFLKAR